MTLLEVRDLVKHYSKRGVLSRTEGYTKAVDGVSFEVEPAQTLGLAGESGCGKSTVARTLMRLETPTAGHAFFDGVDIFEMGAVDLKQLRQDMQIIFQDPHSSLNPRMTVFDIVSEGWRIHKSVPAGNRRHRASELLESVGMNPDHLDRYPHEFSGGQRQRIGIARALAVEPRLIICDEPVSALDVSIQAQIVNLLKKLQTEFGIAYLFIAHDLAVVRHISDSIAVMYLGKIVEQGHETEIFRMPRHPYTQALLSAIPPPDPSTRSTWRPVTSASELPAPTGAESGCAFRSRCWKSRDVCAEDFPPLEASVSGSPSHLDRCFFPEPWTDLHDLPPGYSDSQMRPESD